MVCDVYGVVTLRQELDADGTEDVEILEALQVLGERRWGEGLADAGTQFALDDVDPRVPVPHQIDALHAPTRQLVGGGVGLGRQGTGQNDTRKTQPHSTA